MLWLRMLGWGDPRDSGIKGKKRLSLRLINNVSYNYLYKGNWNP